MTSCIWKRERNSFIRHFKHATYFERILCHCMLMLSGQGAMSKGHPSLTQSKVLASALWRYGKDEKTWRTLQGKRSATFRINQNISFRFLKLNNNGMIKCNGWAMIFSVFISVPCFKGTVLLAQIQHWDLSLNPALKWLNTLDSTPFWALFKVSIQVDCKYTLYEAL